MYITRVTELYLILFLYILYNIVSTIHFLIQQFKGNYKSINFTFWYSIKIYILQPFTFQWSVINNLIHTEFNFLLLQTKCIINHNKYVTTELRRVLQYFMEYLTRAQRLRLYLHIDFFNTQGTIILLYLPGGILLYKTSHVFY